jgi:hypothetical protein
MKLDNWVYFENSHKAVNINDFSIIKFMDNGWLSLQTVNGDDAVLIENKIDVENFKKNVLKLEG